MEPTKRITSDTLCLAIRAHRVLFYTKTFRRVAKQQLFKEANAGPFHRGGSDIDFFLILFFRRNHFFARISSAV